MRKMGEYRIVSDKTKKCYMNYVFELEDFSPKTIYPVLFAYMKLYKVTGKKKYKTRADEINQILAEKEKC